MIHSSLGVDRKVKVVESLKTDAVMGGCLLSAAELDSSKNYIQIDDQWQIAYMVRIEAMLYFINSSASYDMFMTSTTRYFTALAAHSGWSSAEWRHRHDYRVGRRVVTRSQHHYSITATGDTTRDCAVQSGSSTVEERYRPRSIAACSGECMLCCLVLRREEGVRIIWQQHRHYHHINDLPHSL